MSEAQKSNQPNVSGRSMWKATKMKEESVEVKRIESDMQPKDSTTNEAFKGFTNADCPFHPCHRGVKRAFNCLFCYCPLIAYECPGPYRVFTDKNGIKRKDCSLCTLPHDGYRASWNFIQMWLERPVVWQGQKQSAILRDL